MTEPLDDARGVELERIAEIIRDEVRITADGIIYNSTDVAKIILNRAAPARGDAESAGLATFTPITGPGVDALENRKEADNGPSEEQVNADLRRYLVPLPSEAGREAMLAAYNFLQDKAFIPDSDTHLCTKICEQLQAALSPDPGTVAVASANCACTRPGGDPLGNCEECTPSISSTMLGTPHD